MLSTRAFLLAPHFLSPDGHSIRLTIPAVYETYPG